MHQVREFKRSDETFEDRIEADELLTAVGQVVTNFAQLQQMLNAGIAALLDLPAPLNEVLPDAMRFDGKVQAFVALVRHRANESGLFNGRGDPVGRCLVLAEQARRAEALNDRVMRSTQPGGRWAWRRIDSGPEGPTITDEPMDADYMLDIADYIVEAVLDIEGFMVPLMASRRRVVQPA